MVRLFRRSKANKKQKPNPKFKANKKFGEKSYRYHQNYLMKGQASSEVKRLKSKGYSARSVSSKKLQSSPKGAPFGRHAVYKRK